MLGISCIAFVSFHSTVSVPWTLEKCRLSYPISYTFCLLESSLTQALIGCNELVWPQLAQECWSLFCMWITNPFSASSKLHQALWILDTDRFNAYDSKRIALLMFCPSISLFVLIRQQARDRPPRMVVLKWCPLSTRKPIIKSKDRKAYSCSTSILRA